MAYVKGPVTIIDTSPSLIPGNLTFFQDGSAGESDSTMFGVIHKHCLTVGACGSTPDTHYRVSYGKIEDKNTSSYLTQVSYIFPRCVCVGMMELSTGHLVQVGGLSGDLGSHLIQRTSGEQV